ncbi:hypothetical protein Adt_22639 [Abeliophyllum distichum]|uniref:Uncharacterized protein n=1 Tax=Abeliophyllum distichum TaxID=126358 RepID=A0ABD1S8L6_9LAMI
MINCSRLTTTSEETRSWHPNNDSTRGSAFNARTAQGSSLRSKSLAQVPLPLRLNHLAACSKEHNLAQMPLPLGLGHQEACSSQRTQPRSSASPTGTRPPSSLFLPRNTSSLKCLSHWNSAT